MLNEPRDKKIWSLDADDRYKMHMQKGLLHLFIGVFNKNWKFEAGHCALY